MLDRFIASVDHQRTAKKTRYNREQMIKRLRERFDFLLVEDLAKRRVREDFYTYRDELAATPAQADFAMAVLRRVLSWAYKRGVVEINHAREIEKLRAPNKSRKDLVWAPELRAKLLDGAIPELRDLFWFAYLTGAREGDIVDMRWDNFDGQWLVFRPEKTAQSTAVKVQLPVYKLAPLRDLLERLPRKTPFILTSQTGNPWHRSGLRARFTAWRDAVFPAGLDRHFHDIRGTTASALAAASCTEAEIGAITGHAIAPSSELAKYIDRSRQLAINAYDKWSHYEFAESGVVLPFKRA